MSTVVIVQKIAFFSSLIALLIGGLQYFNVLGEHTVFTWICWGFFSVLVVVMVLLSSLAVKAKKVSTNIYVILGSLGLKFVLSLLLVLTYMLIAKPSSPSFILPFLIFYFIYTVLAIYFMLKMFRKQTGDLRREI